MLQVLEEKCSVLQKEKGGEKTEVITLRDKLIAKEQQCALEIKVKTHFSPASECHMESNKCVCDLNQLAMNTAWCSGMGTKNTVDYSK